MASHIPASTALVPSRTQFHFDVKSKFSVLGVGKTGRLSFSVRSMGSSASSQKPDNVQGNSFCLSNENSIFLVVIYFH